MINGLDHANYNQLTGLYDLRASTISTDDIPYEDIYTLKNIDTTQTIQQQIDLLKNDFGAIGSITVSGITISGFVLFSHLTTYYDTSNNIYNTYVNYDYLKSNYFNQKSLFNVLNVNYLTISSFLTLSNTVNNNYLTLSNYINNEYLTISNYIISLTDTTVSYTHLTLPTIYSV